MTAHYNSPVALETSIDYWLGVKRTSHDPVEQKRADDHLIYYMAEYDRERERDLQLGAVRSRVAARRMRNNIRVILYSPLSLAFFVWEAILLTMLWLAVFGIGLAVILTIFGIKL